MADVYVTNFNRNFTGVSATTANVVRVQAREMDAVLVGQPLPGCPAPITVAQARRGSRTVPPGKPFALWHVRRNTEMRAAIWARDVLRLPIRTVFTSAAIRRHSWLPRQLIARMDAVIATTPEAAEFVPGVRAVVPHGVDLERFHPAPDRASAWAETGYPGARGVATIGRVRPEKGTDRFIDAMLALLPERPDVTALVIGRAKPSDRAFEADLKEKVRAAGLSERIVFCGEIAPDRLPALLRALSLLVALPRYEGYGMTPLEAMASAVPFVAMQTGYFRSFAEGGGGQVVDQGDLGAAIAAIGAGLDDTGRLAQMARSAHDRARSHHGIDQEVAGIAEVYDMLWSEA